MKMIGKYSLQLTDRQSFAMPGDLPMPLTVQLQGTHIMVWALIDEAAPLHIFEFLVIGTGQPLNDLTIDHFYLGTVQSYEFVWHVFYRRLN